MGETRRINVYVPPQYDACASQRFPVLYMPDGGLAEDFPHVTNTVDGLIRRGEIQPVIVVGIENTVRRRDMTPPTQTPADLKVTDQPGGAARFRSFFRHELMPVVAARYRVTDEATIIGESLAGLFILDALVAQPEMFDTYIALDPSLWWNSGAMARDLPRQLPALADKPARLLLVAAGAETEAAEVTSFVTALRTSAPHSLTWTYTPRPDLRHDNVYRSLEVPMLTLVFGKGSAGGNGCDPKAKVAASPKK
jgi:predicted alpha/beta superfamily hydrolase